MFCQKCGSNMPEDSKFCVKCGNPVDDSDSQVTQPVSEPVTAEIPSQAAQPVPAVTVPAPAAYVPPQQPYGQPAAYGQTSAPEPKNGFVVSLVGLILVIIWLCLPGLICGIIGFNKANKLKKAGQDDSKTKASWVMGLIAIILGALGTIVEVICLIMFSAAIMAAVSGTGTYTYDDNMMNTITNTYDDTTSDDTTYIDTTTSTDAATEAALQSTVGKSTVDVEYDIFDTVAYSMESYGFDTSTLYVENTVVSGLTDPYEDDYGNMCVDVTGTTTVTYEGQTEDVQFYAYYWEDQSVWYVYWVEFSSYAIFPDGSYSTTTTY